MTTLSRPAERRLGLLLVLPAVAIVLVALLYPLGRQVLMSFQTFGLAQQFGQAPAFAGLENYATVLGDGAFWAALVRSLVFCALCAALTVVIGTAGALLLTAVPRWIAMGVQAVMLVAWAMPVLSSLQVFQWLFDARRGVVNWLLTAVGIDGAAGFNWLSTPVSFFAVAGLLVIWMSVPLVVFMVYAAVTQVDESVIEAARLDGAHGVRLFTTIIMPSIASVFLLICLLEIIWDLRVFTQIHVLQGSSGITESTHVLGTYIYQIGLSGGNYGVAAAAATIMLLLMLLVTGRYIQLLLRGAKD
ncbi:sugar ABC transporter permease [Brachybacterium sp. NBEC-018]|uniref:carbohydrate ABC transporter permease n=1 Tax=Brachybacterium sp. NBEC-018 TaxID=2996004 RepID=UPI002175518C|nr:sugar ABC transporter permease [Brachybacterium sp. NBEC-018]UVY84463.1 sugar ABC transporter permease [Brachybacterium sp. NBEC-018]